MIASTLLHWLISQSLFLVRITVYDYNGLPDTGQQVSAIGYSPLAIIFALCTGSVVLLAVLYVGVMRKLPATMPLAACCSASVAAMCQPRQGDLTQRDVTMMKLQWGVLDDRSSTEDNGNAIQHGSFSAKKFMPDFVIHVYVTTE